MKRLRVPGMGALLLVSLLLLPATLSANNLSNFTTVSNTDFAVFGVGGMRGQGTGSIVVSGISGSVTAAYLYWHGPTSGDDANAAVTFNGTAIIGTNIGISDNNCWGFADSRAYRANVTALVTGNATYTLANFRKAGPPVDDVNGVSLLIFFDDGNPANNRDVVIFNGNDSNQPNAFDADGWNATLAGINYASGTVNMRLIVSDGQVFPDDGMDVNGVAFLPPGGLNWQGDTVPDQGTASQTNGGLWDQKTFDVTSLMTVGPNTLTLTTVSGGSDCLSLIGVIFDLPAGSAPPTPTPTPGGPPPTPTPLPVSAVVPTVSGGGLALMALLLAVVGLGLLALRRSA